MNAFEGLLASDFGFNPQRNSAPMAPSNRSTAGDQDSVFGSAAVQKTHDFGDLFSGSSGFATQSQSSRFGTESKSSNSGGSTIVARGISGFEDLIPGFGRSSPARERSTSGPSWHSEPTFSTSKTTPNVTENPFLVLESSSPEASSSSELFTDPLEDISKPHTSGTVKVVSSTKAGGKTYDDMDPFDGLGKFAPTYTSDRREMENDKGPIKTDKEPDERTSVRSPEQSSVDSDQEAHGMPKVSISSHNSVGQTASPSLHADANFNEADLHHKDMFTESEERFNLDSSDDVWLTVSEIPLFTEPTSATPPSRPPPARLSWVAKDKTISFPLTGARRKDNDISYINSGSSAASPFDELEVFTSGRSQKDVNYHANGLSTEELEMRSTAAAMKDAMDRAEAKFSHAKEVRGRETTKSSRSREQLDKEKLMQDAQGHESIQREMEEEERLQKRLDKERERAKEIEREREEKEREQRRFEMERERARETEREREHARQAVQRATREARERAAAEARLKAERSAVGKINAEARESATAEARQRAEKAAAEARGRANSEAREKEAQDRAAAAKTGAEAQLRAERAAVQRAGQEARERAAAAARLNQQKNANDLDSFFSKAQDSSAPRPGAIPSDPMFNTQFQNEQWPGVPKPSGTSPSMKKASSATNFNDDLASIFGGALSSGDLQDVEGETKEMPRPSLEKHRRTHERPVKALDEKKQRDLQAQRDQVERHRIAETLDIEIKRWAAGKEGNLRALLSTLQYVLWPECGWQPVSLTGLITAAMVKKVYRKSILCTHPDKVQQNGATLQQIYIAEKVFDILQEAWNKFKSEELF